MVFEGRTHMTHTASRFAVLLLMLTSPAWAQGPVRLTQDEAVNRALENSHRLAEANARVTGAQATIRSRQAAEQPTLTASGGYTRTNHVDPFAIVQPVGGLRVLYPDAPDNYYARLAFQWPIFTFGRTDALIRAAEAEARASSEDVRTARADLRLETIRAYWALVTAIETDRVLQEAVGRADATVRDALAGLTRAEQVRLVSLMSKVKAQLTTLAASDPRADFSDFDSIEDDDEVAPPARAV